MYLAIRKHDLEIVFSKNTNTKVFNVKVQNKQTFEPRSTLSVDNVFVCVIICEVDPLKSKTNKLVKTCVSMDELVFSSTTCYMYLCAIQQRHITYD